MSRRRPTAVPSPAARSASAKAARRAGAATAEPPSTRERVLELTHELIRRRGNAAISLVEVAAEAGLSRQMLYVMFGSRAGLLMALVDHLDARSGGAARLTALRESLPPLEAFEPYLRAWFDYLPVVLPVARALAAAATSGDADAAEAWHSRLRKLRHGFTVMTRAFKSAGVLKAGWTPESAAEWMLALTQVDLWQHLVVEAGWKPAVHIDRVIATLRQTLLEAG